MENTTDIPRNLIESCEKYPKYKWVYETTKLLETQNITWSVYCSEQHPCAIDVINYGDTVTYDDIPCELNTTVPGKIFVSRLEGEELFTEVAIVKGKMKWLTHYKHIDYTNNYIKLDYINGDIELKINALMHIYFPKYVGIINVQSVGKELIGINLFVNDKTTTNKEDYEKKLVKLYHSRAKKEIYS